MTCPPEIADVLLRILTISLLTTRVAGWAGDASRCALEANHVHNLPDLLANFKPQLLEYYWRVEKVSFERDSNESEIRPYQPLWAELEPFIGRAEEEGEGQ